jgi:hypothetical protein
MNPRAFLGAAGGAVIGAVIWGMLTVVTGMEIGYVAWAVGGLVGFGAAALGGRGTQCGALCAVLAVVSIFSGKMIAANAILKKAMDKVTSSSGLFNKAAYDEARADAEAFSKIKAESDHAAFMVERKFTKAESPQKVSAEKLKEFRENQVPHLRQIASEKPSFEAWQADQKRKINEAMGQSLSLTQIVVKSLGPIDILFGLLGVATAYRLGLGKGEGGPGDERPEKKGFA